MDSLNNNTENLGLLFACLVLFVLGIPLALKLIPPNGIYGFRTASTKANTDLWWQVNTFLGRALVVAALAAGAIITLASQISDRWGTVTVVGPAVLAVLASLLNFGRCTRAMNKQRSIES